MKATPTPTKANLIIVAPTDQVRRLLQAGFKSGGRSNHFTATLMKSYEDEKNAVADARVLPPGVVWTIESARA